MYQIARGVIAGQANGAEDVAPNLDPMPKQLITQDAVEALIARPGPVWLFKHSNSCGVSAAALAQLDTFLAASPTTDIGMVVVQDSRPLSSWISTRLRYVHQSPQLFLLRDGAVAWSASHWAINAEAMTKALAGASASA